METTTNKYLEMKEFNFLHDLNDEIDALTSFMTDYNSGYVCDVIGEVADSNVPIYTSDVWENVSKIQEYVEEAIEEGLAPTDGRDIDLIRIFQAGYYVYYQRSLYNNLDTMVYNMIVDKVNVFLNENSEEYDGNVDLDKIIEDIEMKSDGYDNNNQMEDIFNEADDIIEGIKNCDYEL